MGLEEERGGGGADTGQALKDVYSQDKQDPAGGEQTGPSSYTEQGDSCPGHKPLFNTTPLATDGKRRGKKDREGDRSAEERAEGDGGKRMREGECVGGREGGRGRKVVVFVLRTLHPPPPRGVPALTPAQPVPKPTGS
ncbi:unnamed protein product [Pleuronectes platessa]|uniref:Uncharacterized protein n=1 Tax=Pleuronectes platessa TaxID=8262 RepID=A0A9N7TGY1_PLEPL|nr:unnamed protein product [Pleuronectes platessa]